MLAVALLTWLLLNKTHLGRQLFAVGGDAESARRIGIRVGLLHLFAYGYLGVMAAIGGLVQVYRMGRWCPMRWWAASSTYWRRRCWAAPV